MIIKIGVPGKTLRDTLGENWILQGSNDPEGTLDQ